MKLRDLILSALLVALIAGSGSSVQATDDGEEFRAGEVVVELKPGATVEAVNERNRTTTIQQIYGTNFYRLRTPSGKKEKKWRKRLDKDKDVLSAALNPVITSPSLLARVTVSFPDGFAKPGFTLADFESQSALFDLLRLEEVKQRSRGRDVVVAVIDTGVDYTHPALAVNLWKDARSDAEIEGDQIDNDGDGLVDDARGWDFVDNDNDPVETAADPETTVAGHGTFIAGIITTIAPECRILPVRAFPAGGTTDGFTVAAAVKYAADHGANVINLSLGSSVALDLLRDAIRDARARGITIVAAVGNDNTDSPQFPSDMDEVVAVAAIDLSSHKATFSNFGAHIDLCAPGANLVSAYPGSRSGGYAEWSGTSFAAPFAAAEAALVIAADPRIADAKKTMEETAVNIDDLNPAFAGKLGKGRIDPLGALQNLSTGSNVRPPTDVHSQVELSGGASFGKATINVVGTKQEFTFEAYRLNVRATYKLIVDGNLVASNATASLGSLRFAFSNAQGPLTEPLNPVTRIRRVELRDSLDRLVLQGDFDVDGATPFPRAFEKEARLAPTGDFKQAGGRATIRVESIREDLRRESLIVSAEGLISDVSYRVLVDGMLVEVLTARFGFVRAHFTSDGSSGQLLPPLLRPVLNIKRLEVQDARTGQTVLAGNFPLNPM
ncbi:MAG: S8 family serine peptidase [Blastocatellia bacterium]